MPDNLTKPIDGIINPTKELFNPENIPENTEWVSLNSVANQQTYRFFTTDIERDTLSPFLKNVELLDFTLSLEDIMENLFSSTCNTLFKKNFQDMKRKLSLKRFQRLPWTIIEISRYLGVSDIPQSEIAGNLVNGLLSITLVSTNPGLELYDPVRNQWVEFKSDERKLGIISCGTIGQQVSDGFLRAALHRVVPHVEDRISVTYQIGTQLSQLHGLSPTSAQTEKHTGIPSTKRGKGGLNRKKKKLANIEKKRGVPVTKRKEKGERKKYNEDSDSSEDDLLKKESELGVPITKDL